MRRWAWQLVVPAALLLGAAGLLVFGWADDAVGLVARYDTDRDVEALAEAQSWEDRGDAGPPTLLPGDRVLAFVDRLQEAAGRTVDPEGAEGAVLLPGVTGVDFRAECNRLPEGVQERNLLPLRTLTVHTSEEDLGETAGVRAVCRYHSQDLGWGRGGYHFYVTKGGTVYRLLADEVMPYAQLTRNGHDLAIVLQGRANRGVPTEAQTSALYRLTEALLRRYGALQVYGHRDWTVLDAREGREPANTHVDPGLSWDVEPRHWGLDALRLRVLGQAPVTAPSRLSWGYATWYGEAFAGRPTASGELYDPEGLTTAVYRLASGAPAWPFGTTLRVSSGSRAVVVRVTDTGLFGPAPAAAAGTLQHRLDLSKAAFAALADPKRGRVAVRIEVVP